jgi:hypothetical protein
MHVQTVGEVPENLKKKSSPRVSSIIDTLVDTPKIIQQEKILKCRMHVQTVGEVPENLKKKRVQEYPVLLIP